MDVQQHCGLVSIDHQLLLLEGRGAEGGEEGAIHLFDRRAALGDSASPRAFQHTVLGVQACEHRCIESLHCLLPPREERYDLVSGHGRPPVLLGLQFLLRVPVVR